jgi:hypothetical protein
VSPVASNTVDLATGQRLTLFGAVANTYGHPMHRWLGLDDLSVIGSKDPTRHGELLHVSIARQDRYPSWDEILAVKEAFFGDVDAMMVLPKKSDYVNIHNHCFHLWQTPAEWGVL